jgi:hypothetical protein
MRLGNWMSQESMSNIAYSRELGQLLYQNVKECPTLLIGEGGVSNMIGTPVDTGG